MHKIGNVSPEFPMLKIIDIEVIKGWGVVKVSLNGSYDGVNNVYYLPASD